MDKELIKKLLEELSLESRDLLGSIQRIKAPDALTFFRDYVSPCRPVIITNLCKCWPAMKKWNYSYMRSKVGSKSVQIAVTPDGWADSVQNKIFQLPEERIMEFSKFLDKMENDENGDEIFYLQRQNGCLTLDYPELTSDVPKDIGFVSKALNKEPDAINLWIGGSKSISSLHRDPYENIYSVIKGKKIFKLFPPTDRGFIKYENFKVMRFEREKRMNGI